MDFIWFSLKINNKKNKIDIYYSNTKVRVYKPLRLSRALIGSMDWILFYLKLVKER